MLRSQEIQTKLNTLREERDAAQRSYMAAEPEKRESAETEYRATVDRTDVEAGKLYAAQQEAFSSEEREYDALKADAAAGRGPVQAAEVREFIDIERRSRVSAFLDRAVNDAQLVGAEAEYRAALVKAGVEFRSEKVVPWGLLLDPEKLAEHRAILTGVGGPTSGEPGAMQDSIVREVFNVSVLAFLGTRFSSAGIGDVVVPVLTAAAASVRTKAQQIAGAGSIALRSLTPRRFTARYELSGQDLMRVRGLESTVRADLLPAAMEALEKASLSGTGTTGSVVARVTPTDMSAAATFATGLAAFASAIDGRFARSYKQLKIAINPTVIQHMYGLIQSNTAVTLADYLMMQSGGLLCSANLPAVSSTISDSIVCKTGPGAMYNAAAKMWGGGMEVTRDDKSNSDLDQVNITGALYGDFDVQRPSGYYVAGYKSS